MATSIEDRLKIMMIEQYGTVKSFSEKIKVSNSTVNSMLRRGIMNATIETVFSVANALNISIDGLTEGKILPKTTQIEPPKESEDIKTLKHIYGSINKEGKQQLMLQADLIGNSPKYLLSPPQAKRA